MNEHKICINEACSTAQVLYDRKKKVMVLQEAQLVPQPLESQEVQDLPETGWLRIIFLV